MLREGQLIYAGASVNHTVGIVKRLPRRLDMPAKIFDQREPLTDAALDRLGDCLRSCKGGREMSVEQLDGFFAALIAGSETVMPSEY